MDKNVSDDKGGREVTDKRKAANLRVRMRITEALFALMHHKPFADITVTEIIQEAGVARASYYRNYDSKEDVLAKLVEEVLFRFRDEADYDLTEYFTYGNVLRSFQYFALYGEYVLDLYESGFGAGLLEGLNEFHEAVAGTMPVHSIERYKLYLYMGALFNTAIMWLKNGKKESAEDIAKVFCRYIGIK